MPAAHLRKPFDPQMVRRIAAEMEIRRRKLGAELVVVRGLSGILVASAMNTLFETPIAVVRKPDEKSHGHEVEMIEEKMEVGGWNVEQVKYNDWIIVDDLIASGQTVNIILETIEEKKYSNVRGRCRAILLYNSDERDQSFHEWGDESIPVYEIGKV